MQGLKNATEMNQTCVFDLLQAKTPTVNQIYSTFKY